MRLLVVALLACSRPPPSAAEPPGSRLVGSVDVCLQQLRGDTWERVGLVNDAGQPAVTGTAVRGPWYFPSTGGRFRIIPCKELEP